MISIKIEVTLEVSLEINESKLPQISKWDNSIHEKMCRIVWYFPIYYFPFLIILSRFSTFQLRVTFRQPIQSSHFKKETLQLISLTETFLLSLPSPLTNWEHIEYLCFYSASLMSSEQHWITLLSSLFSSFWQPLSWWLLFISNISLQRFDYSELNEFHCWLSCPPSNCQCVLWLLHTQNAELPPSGRATSHALCSPPSGMWLPWLQLIFSCPPSP